ncbi:MAG TPA: NADP-dependent oxidoreductase [Gemmatimonadales bacterium]|nr:NADP-dependent oxidoreductase [Gemmatimonadales bacterium]
MKALVLVRSAPNPLLVEQEMPRPEPQPGQVVVRVHAVAVTPTELLWYPTSHTRDGGPRNAAVLGHEFSGEVAECGEGVTDVAIGQDVYGMNDWFAEGALAEYCVTRPEWIANKPQRLSHEQAASVPISALTAWQGLFERGRLQPAERVLIHGGAGAVGMFAVQLAHSHGAQVITTVSANNITFVKSLGAEEALDYRGKPFEDCVREIDLVFDTVGGDTLRRSWQVLKPGGRVVTVAVDSESESDERVQQAFFIVEPNRMQLVEVSKLLQSGTLQTMVNMVLPVSAATEAYGGNSARQGRGKLVISTRQWFTPKPPPKQITNQA